MDKNLVVFENKHIRRVEHNGELWFSVVDIVGVLTDSPVPRKYWNTLKTREPQLSSVCGQLKLQSSDGRFYKTDCANTEGVLRIIMSVPSPKAEPFKLWLAEVGKERIEETYDPEIGFERLKELYRAKGYPEEWIERRLQSIETRKQLTDEWKKRNVKEGEEFSILTATIAKGTFGMTPSEHAKMKGLDKQNLRDHMTPLELIFTALGEEITRSIAVRDDAQGFNENHDAATEGGHIAGKFRRETEAKGIQVVSDQNYLPNNQATPLPESDAQNDGDA